MARNTKNLIEGLEQQIRAFAGKDDFEGALESARETNETLAASGPSNAVRTQHVRLRIEILESICRMRMKQKRALAETYRASTTVDKLWRKREYAKGADMVEKLLWIREGILGGTNPFVASAYTTLGLFQLQQSDFEPAERCFRRAVEMTKENAPLEFAHASRCWGCLHLDTDAHEKAEPLFRDALIAYSQLFGWECEDVARCLLGLSLIADRRGDEWKRRKLLGETMLAWATWFAHERPKLARRLADNEPLKNPPREIPDFWRDDERALELLRTIFRKIIANEN